MENLELSELKFPSMREELVSYLAGLSDSDYQFRAWVERSSPNLAYDELDYTIHFLYDDTGLAENAYTWIGLVLKNDQEARAIEDVVQAIDAQRRQRKQDRRGRTLADAGVMTPVVSQREIPPTAGLPLRWQDLFNRSGDLARDLARQLDIPLPALPCSGTAALIMALRVLQQRTPGRTELIVPAYTCPLVALAAHHCPPLRVVACDLQPGSIDLDEHQLAQLCNQNTLAIVVTHLAGRVADVEAAKRIAEPLGIAVIEDAAQAMGALDDGKSVGLKGDIGFFSMALGKGLTTAEGGVLFSRDPALHQALHQQCRQDLPFSLRWEVQRSAELWGYAAAYQPRGLKYVYGKPLRAALARGDEVAAVGDDFSVNDIPLHRLGGYRQKVGAAALARLPEHLQQGRLRALRRVAQLSSLPGVSVLTDSPGQQGTWPFLMVVMPSAQTRDTAMAQLWTAGLGVTRLFIHVLPGYPALTPLLQQGADIPRAQSFAAQTLSISNSHWLTDELFEQVLDHLRRILKR